jgi:hypothetical protein
MTRAMMLGLSCALAACSWVAPPLQPPVYTNGKETCLLLETARCSYLADRVLPSGAGRPTTGSVIVKTTCLGTSPDLKFDEVYLFVAARPTAGAQARDAVLVARLDREAIIAFRGTLPFGDGDDNLTTLQDWLNDADVELVPDAALHLGEKGVEKGFDDSLNNLWTATTSDNATFFSIVKGWVDHHQVDVIDVIGHSKGGALATIGALRMVQSGLDPRLLRVTTFASARPGNAAFAAIYNHYPIHTVRYENTGDVIPHLPPTPEENSTVASLLFLAYVKPGAGMATASNQGPEQIFSMTSRIEADSPYMAVGDLQYIVPGASGNAPPVVINPPPGDSERISNFLAHIKQTRVDEWSGFIVDAHTIDPPSPGKSGRGMDPYGYSGEICKP